MRLGALASAAVLILAVAVAAPAAAQSLDDQLRAQLRTVMGELNDLQNNQATLETQKAAAEKERDELRTKLAAAQHAGGAASSGGEVDQLKSDNSQLTTALKQAQDDLARFKDAYAQVVADEQKVQAERDRALQDSANATGLLADCETKNIQLVKIGRDVLSAYAKVGVRDALERGEPFIGLKRVKMETIAQDYGDKVYEAKFDPHAVKKPISGAAPASGASPAAPPPSAGSPAPPPP
jgi:septal ring factor EnvC (AmiA/AmiB activator)